MANFNELERIITTGYSEKEFKIINFKVKMRTLTAGETREIANDLSGYDDIAKYRGLQIKALSRCIMSINDKPVMYSPENEKDTITDEKKYRQNEEIIGKWQQKVVELFYNKYRELEDEQADFLLKSKTPSESLGQEKNGKQEKPSV